MASLEPPIPVNVAEHFDDRGSAVDTEVGSVKSKKSTFGRFSKAGKRTVGLVMLAIVVFLWTASNFLASVSTPHSRQRARRGMSVR
jgi:hypothetical protein